MTRAAGTLSPRQRQVLALIAEGLTTHQIGERIHISRSTAGTYAAQMVQRLNASNRAHAVAIGYRRGILGQSVTAERDERRGGEGRG